MANIVNGQASAYDTLDQLKGVHAKILAEMEKELADIRGIIGKENGFYADSTCKKINTILDSFEKQIFTEIKSSFEISEKSVESMEKMLIGADTF